MIIFINIKENHEKNSRKTKQKAKQKKTKKRCEKQNNKRKKNRDKSFIKCALVLSFGYTFLLLFYIRKIYITITPKRNIVHNAERNVQILFSILFVLY